MSCCGSCSSSFGKECHIWLLLIWCTFFLQACRPLWISCGDLQELNRLLSNIPYWMSSESNVAESGTLLNQTGTKNRHTVQKYSQPLHRFRASSIWTLHAHVIPNLWTKLLYLKHIQERKTQEGQSKLKWIFVWWISEAIEGRKYYSLLLRAVLILSSTTETDKVVW